MNKLIVLLIFLLLSACQTQTSKELNLKKSEFQLDDVVKADVDMFAEVLMQHSLEYLHLLARKLYLRNPNQLQRAQLNDIDPAVLRIFSSKWPAGLPELGGKRSAEAIHLAFDESYKGDRVAALISGLHNMLLDAYGGNTQFYLHDTFYPQKIYNLARNFEVAFWKLGHDRNARGELFLLTNATAISLVLNLSFERLYGKLISLHDQMAVVMANSSNRYIKNIIQRVATMVFLPI
ncbi:MAG: hypothetical protein QM479_11895 [Pseudomonadota bacterium]